MKIARKIEMITDKKRKVLYGDNECDRQVILSVFYPTLSSYTTQMKSSYLDLFSPHRENYIDVAFKDLDDDKKTEHLKYLQSIEMNFVNATVENKDSSKYPVIIFSPGYMMDRDSSSFIIEQLVSNNFIVITLGHLHETPFTFLPDGKFIKGQNQEITYDEKIELIVDRSKDIDLVVELPRKRNLLNGELKGMLDESRICLVGHSFGGAASYKYSLNTEGIRALVLWDASLQYLDDLTDYKDFTIPLLNMRRGLCNYDDEIAFFIKENSMKMQPQEFENRLATRKKVSQRQYDNQQKLYKSITGRKSFIKVHGSVHMSFTDDPIVSPSRDDNAFGSNKGFYRIISDVTSAFLNDILCIDKDSYEKKLKEYLGAGIDIIHQ